MAETETPSTISFTQDAGHPEHWVFDLTGLMPMPLLFWYCDSLLRRQPAVARTRVAINQYHIWLTGENPQQAWSHLIRPLLIVFLSAVFGWSHQPTPVERRSTKPMAQIL